MRLAAAELAARKEANLGGSARVVFPLGDVAAEDGAEVGANEVVTEEESEFVAHRSPELEAAEAKAVRDAADAMAERAELGAEAAPAAAPAPAPAAEVEDAARPDDGRAIVPATVVEPTPAGNAITRFFRRLFGK